MATPNWWSDIDVQAFAGKLAQLLGDSPSVLTLYVPSTKIWFAREPQLAAPAVLTRTRVSSRNVEIEDQGASPMMSPSLRAAHPHIQVESESPFLRAIERQRRAVEASLMGLDPVTASEAKARWEAMITRAASELRAAAGSDPAHRSMLNAIIQAADAAERRMAQMSEVEKRKFLDGIFPPAPIRPEAPSAPPREPSATERLAALLSGSGLKGGLLQAADEHIDMLFNSGRVEEAHEALALLQAARAET